MLIWIRFMLNVFANVLSNYMILFTCFIYYVSNIASVLLPTHAYCLNNLSSVFKTRIDCIVIRFRIFCICKQIKTMINLQKKV